MLVLRSLRFQTVTIRGGDYMATYIERTTTAPVEARESTGAWFVIGLITLLAVLFLLFYYGLPALRSGFGTPQINVPGRVDVNVNTPQGQGNPAPQAPVQNPQ